MPTYTTVKAQSVSGGSDSIFEFPAITLPSGERFKRCKITKAVAYLSYCELRGNAQTALGRTGFDTWTTDRTAISWHNGKSSKVKIHNTDSTSHAWTITITVESEYEPTYTITCNSGTGGTLTANKSSATEGTTITLTPTAAAGYVLASLTNNRGVTITNNKFSMPANNITVTAAWTQVSFAITKATSPAGAGTVSGASTATAGQSVTMTQVPAAGYYFNGWQISAGTISSGGVFTMPAQAVTVTAKYLRRSTATLNKSTLIGGENAQLTISSEKSTFSHKYQLSFGTGMETALTDVPAGTLGVNIAIPAAWAEEIPNAATKSGGTLKVETYNGTTKIGEYTISGLTYQVPEDAVPDITSLLTSVARTIGSTTYANIGDYYVQGHCGVRIQAEAEGTYDATIASMTAKVDGYNGDHSHTEADDEIDFTTGLLTIAGTATVTVTATDSRGRTATETATITVMPYTAPAGTLDVYRADVNGDADDVGTYGRFTKSQQYTQIGSNSLTVTLTSQGSSATPGSDSGDLLPGARQTFQAQYEYTITLTLADAFETTVITAKIRSAKFVIHVDAGGDRMAFFEAVNKQVPTGKTSVLQISGDTQVYIGNQTLEQYIQSLIS